MMLKWVFLPTAKDITEGVYHPSLHTNIIKKSKPVEVESDMLPVKSMSLS